MKGFLSQRPLPPRTRALLLQADSEIGATLAEKLQGALPAINLSAGSALSSAFGNDVSAELAYAQAVCCRM
jgi:D-sedoheptulose 7-phosphate isomerase